jgi:hypothetical protein
MDVLREREVKDSLERQLTEEQKLRGKSNHPILIFSVSSRASNFKWN